MTVKTSTAAKDVIPDNRKQLKEPEIADVPEETRRLNIYERLAAVRNEVQYIQKDKEVQGYMVVTHDMVTAHVRPALDKYGVIVMQNLMQDNVVQETGMATSRGVPIIRYEAIYAVHFIAIDDKEDFVAINVRAHANDTGDKAPGKAMSYAMKYAMLKTLNIETGEAEEARIAGEAPTLTEEQVFELHAMLEQHEIPADETLNLMAIKAFGVENVKDIRADFFEDAKKMISIKVEHVLKERDAAG